MLGLERPSICAICLVALVMLCSPSPVGAQNLLQDGGFEILGSRSGQSPWIVPAVDSVRNGVGKPPAGSVLGESYAASLSPVSDYKAELAQPLLPLVPGRPYVLSAWVRAEQPGIQAYIGVRSEKGFPRIYRGLSGEGWERIELQFTASEGWAQVVLSTTAGATLWDDITLLEGQTAIERVAAEWEKELKQGKELYTGLVVNAKGSGLERGMSPKIWDATGRLVFAGVDASFDQLIRKGLVAYEKSLEAATAHPRLAVSDAYPMRLPLVVDAQGVSGMPRTGVIIGAEDARRVRAATNEYDFLGRFAIIFVVD
jgi:hypothetical protein